MFTGLVAAKGTVAAIEGEHGGGASLEVSTPLAEQLTPGASIAVNGVCVTAVEANGGRFRADLVAETVRRSALGLLRAGAEVNVELPLRAGEPLGGHFVQGHVDGVGEVESVREDGRSRLLRIAVGPELARYVAEKGSVALDGVSLTVTEVDEEGFSVALIPETLSRTTLGSAVEGSALNVEVDLLAKYVERLVVRA
jgi:riboflavin synthase